MKVLGISFGRKNQRSDVLVKEALFCCIFCSVIYHSKKYIYFFVPLFRITI